MDSEPHLNDDQSVIARRAANEGIPIAAIARVLQKPFDLIAANLRRDHSLGLIGEVPRPDWPGAEKWDARMPTVPRTANIEDMEFACRQFFKLTRLEAGFLVVLLRYACAEKAQLHAVIETQRTERPLQPDTHEVTDQKMVDVMICKLRKKLANAGFDGTVQTSWGKGYYIEPEAKGRIYQAVGVAHVGVN